MSDNEARSPFAPLAGATYLVLTTYRKTGVGVSTPVWFVEAGGKLYITTSENTGKVKRIRNNTQVMLAPCNAWGKTSGPTFPARARLLPQAEFGVAETALHDKYRAQYDRVRVQLAANPGEGLPQHIYIEVTPAE